MSGFFEMSAETPAAASPGGGSHDSGEQSLRSSVHKQERDRIEFGGGGAWLLLLMMIDDIN